MEFQLHPRLAADTLPVASLELSELLLMNDSRYVWLILVPRQTDATEVYHLSATQRNALMEEISRVAQVLAGDFGGDKINVGALGNLVPQLHIHVILRRHDDAAWPGPVWGQGQAEPYSAEAAAEGVKRLRESLSL